jgi:hypothetical protein
MPLTRFQRLRAQRRQESKAEFDAMLARLEAEWKHQLEKQREARTSHTGAGHDDDETNLTLNRTKNEKHL